MNFHKMKCVDCDFIFLVENDGQWEKPYDFDCPNCNKESKYLGDVVVKESGDNE